MTDLDLQAEAKRRVQRSTPSITDEQWAQWLATVATRHGRIVLTLDGCRAEYAPENSPASEVSAAKGVT